MNSLNNRRNFLKTLGVAGTSYISGLGLSASPGLSFANSTSNGAIVVIFQRGGCDGFDIIAPNETKEQQFYRSHRPSAGLSENEISDSENTILGTNYALNPALSGLRTAINNRHVTFFPGTHVGVAQDNVLVGSMSHFAAQDIVESGGGGKNYRDILASLRDKNQGWIARTVDLSNANAEDLNVFGFSSDKAHLGLNNYGYYVSKTPNIGQKGSFSPVFDPNNYYTEKLENRNSTRFLNEKNEKWRELQNGFFDLSVKLSQADGKGGFEYANVSNALGYSVINEDGFKRLSPMADVLSKTEALLKGAPELQVITINQGDYDSHNNQRQRSGKLLKDLGDNLGNFYHRMSASDSVRSGPVEVVVVTEFGRTFDENGSAGTDHGQGYTAIHLSTGVGQLPHNKVISFGTGFLTTTPSLRDDLIKRVGARLYVRPVQDYRDIIGQILRKRIATGNISVNPFEGTPDGQGGIYQYRDLQFL